MYVITFYSFKGGVGRTMALVNVAAELVRRGRKVLVVDFDLEAPGVTTYKYMRPPKPSPGAVEYVTEFIRTNESPDVSRFVYPVDLTPVLSRLRRRKSRKQAAAADSQESTGQLWVMPAGKGDAAYGAALAAIDWNSLYENQQGYLFFEDTKLQWEKSFKPDYVLIDSRTGHTDVGGICTRQLADAVVLMFAPNEQNLTGLENVVRAIRREKTEGVKKRIRLHFVAANVPDLDDETGILRRQLRAFRVRLDFEELSGVIRRYENLTLLNQAVFTLARPHTRLARTYRRLVRTLVKDNGTDRDGVLWFLEDYQRDAIGRYFDNSVGAADRCKGIVRLGEIVEFALSLKDAEILRCAINCLMLDWDLKPQAEFADLLSKVAPDFVAHIEKLGQRADLFRAFIEDVKNQESLTTEKKGKGQ